MDSPLKNNSWGKSHRVDSEQWYITILLKKLGFLGQKYLNWSTSSSGSSMVCTFAKEQKFETNSTNEEGKFQYLDSYKLNLSFRAISHTPKSLKHGIAGLYKLV